MNLKKVGMSERSVNNYTKMVDEILIDMEYMIGKMNVPKKNTAAKEVIEEIKAKSLKLMNITNKDMTLNENYFSEDTEPIIEYEVRAGACYMPAVNAENNGLGIALQRDVTLKVNEITKIDLGVRISNKPRGFYVVVKPRKNITNQRIIINTDLITVSSDEYMKISIQNVAEMEIRIPAGTYIVDLVLRGSSADDFSLNNVVHMDLHESGYGFEVFSCNPSEKEEKCEHGESVIFQKTEISENISMICDALGILNSDSITIGNLKINMLGNRDQRVTQIDECRIFENNNMHHSSRKMERRMPVLAVSKKMSGTEIENPSSDTYSDTQAVHAADLLENRRISMDMLASMQAQDPNISVIRENLQGNPAAYHSFILKNGVVCKKYTLYRQSKTCICIYVPTVILKAVILYIHSKNMHTSISQTQKEFAANYYHPRGNKIV